MLPAQACQGESKRHGEVTVNTSPNVCHRRLGFGQRLGVPLGTVFQVEPSGSAQSLPMRGRSHTALPSQGVSLPFVSTPPPSFPSSLVLPASDRAPPSCPSPGQAAWWSLCRRGPCLSPEVSCTSEEWPQRSARTHCACSPNPDTTRAPRLPFCLLLCKPLFHYTVNAE